MANIGNNYHTGSNPVSPTVINSYDDIISKTLGLCFKVFLYPNKK